MSRKAKNMHASRRGSSFFKNTGSGADSYAPSGLGSSIEDLSGSAENSASETRNSAGKSRSAGYDNLWEPSTKSGSSKNAEKKANKEDRKKDVEEDILNKYPPARTPQYPLNPPVSTKGMEGTVTVVESDKDYLLLPRPEMFNSYPPEVQRKIMEWADRDVRARRDDESRRQDALVREQNARARFKIAIPVAIIALCVICATISGIATKSVVLAVAFLVVALAVIIAMYFTRKNDLYAFAENPEDEKESQD